MREEQELTPIEQRTVSFYGDELTAIRASDGHIYVSVRHLCDALGLSRQAQVRRIKRDEVLVDGYKGGAIMAPPSATGVGGGLQQAGLLRVDLVPLWLTGIRVSMVKEEIQAKLHRYKVEASRVLWEAFQEGRLTADPDFNALLTQNTPAVQAYQMLQAMARLARQQILLEARQELQQAQLRDHEQRLESIEATLGDPGRTITPEQASQISQAVKAIALILSKRSGSNQYGSVYGELYRKFGITGYKLLPAHKFSEAITWLTEWHQSLVGEEPF
ncbi:MAG: phage antirepressor N-terminal domain-containing protein [Chloroflexota bacterium]